MSKKRHHHEEHEEHVNHEAWVIPYADMLTLLMALFLVMWAIGQVDLVEAEGGVDRLRRRVRPRRPRPARAAAAPACSTGRTRSEGADPTRSKQASRQDRSHHDRPGHATCSAATSSSRPRPQQLTEQLAQVAAGHRPAAPAAAGVEHHRSGSAPRTAAWWSRSSPRACCSTPATPCSSPRAGWSSTASPRRS